MYKPLYVSSAWRLKYRRIAIAAMHEMTGNAKLTLSSESVISADTLLYAHKIDSGTPRKIGNRQRWSHANT